MNRRAQKNVGYIYTVATLLKIKYIIVKVGERILRTSCNQMEDVKAAFRVFDYNNDGSISREELRYNNFKT